MASLQKIFEGETPEQRKKSPLQKRQRNKQLDNILVESSKSSYQKYYL